MSKNLMDELKPNTPPEGYHASLRSRLIVAAVLIAIFVPTFVIGGWIFLFAIVIFAILAILEVIKAPRKKYGWWVYAATYVIALSYIYWFIIKYNLAEYLSNPDSFVFSLEDYYRQIDISIVGIGASLLLYFCIAVFDPNFSFHDVMYFFTMTLIIGMGFQSAYLVRYQAFYVASSGFADYPWWNDKTASELLNEPLFKFWISCELFIFVCFGALMTDASAYFGGIFFGKHKMNPRISPKKTWEGFFFGIIGGSICMFAFGMIFALVGLPMLPYLDRSHWYYILFLSVCVPLVSVLGDLSFSLIKRTYGVKDFGNILRGHGGILDRLDSVLFSLIFTATILVFLVNNFNFLA